MELPNILRSALSPPSVNSITPTTNKIKNKNDTAACLQIRKTTINVLKKDKIIDELLLTFYL